MIQMRIIFCDVDGVLNNAKTRGRSPSGYTGVSNDLIRNLRKIVDATNAKIVLSSDWRLVKDDPEHGKDYRYLVRKLYSVSSLRITDHTDDITWSKRGTEIRKYLADHTNVSQFVVLDDIPFRDFKQSKLLNNLVLTNPKEGLTDQDVERAIKILRGEAVAPCNIGFF